MTRLPPGHAAKLIQPSFKKQENYVTKNITASASAATLTEEELFAEFLESEVIDYDKRGRKRHRGHVADLIEPLGQVLEIDLQVHNAGSDPSDHLEMAENDLRGALDNVQLARKAFEHLKAERLIMPEEPDDDDMEAYKAWSEACWKAENEPRYRSAAMLTSVVGERGRVA